MNREKQIEERNELKRWLEYHTPLTDFKREEIADELIFNQGYRKTSDVINEFSEELIKRFYDLEYNANTPRKTVKVDELRAQVDWILHEVAINTVKDFTKKYVEANNNDL